MRITATGAGSESDLTVVSSQLHAGQDLSLSAQDQLSLIAAKNTQTQQSSNKSSSASVGVSVGLGSSGAVTPTASFNSSRGKANEIAPSIIDAALQETGGYVVGKLLGVAKPLASWFAESTVKLSTQESDPKYPLTPSILKFK